MPRLTFTKTALILHAFFGLVILCTCGLLLSTIPAIHPRLRYSTNPIAHDNAAPTSPSTQNADENHDQNQVAIAARLAANECIRSTTDAERGKRPTYPRRFLVTLTETAPSHDEHFSDLFRVVGNRWNWNNAGSYSSEGDENTNTPGVTVRHAWHIGNFRGYSLEFKDEPRCVEFWTAAAESASGAHEGNDRVGEGGVEMAPWHQAVMHVEVDYHGAVNAVATQENPPWGLDRIDQKTLPLNNEYTYLDTAGDGVDIYVVDTGININHTEFEGRAVWGVTVRTDGAPDYDDNGHGSHVAGIAGGKTYGAAKAVKLIAVKALDGNGAGPFSELIDGLQWVARTAPGTGRPSVVNLSIQGAVSQALNQACTGLITLGIHVISATGNSGEDACGYSPAVIAPQTAIISVGAVDDTDAVPPFSNYGACVSLLGPGVNILSVDGSTNNGTLLMSGTSMAAPYVSGTVAVFLSSPSTTVPKDPAGLKQHLLSNADAIAAGNGGVAVGVFNNL